MRYIYDNSTNNVRNPNSPPKVVSYGPNSTDEMAELWLQLVVRDASEREKFLDAYAPKTQRVFWDYSQFLLRKNPNDPRAHLNLAVLTADRNEVEALAHYHQAIAAKPDFEEAYFDLGIFLLDHHRLREAETALEGAIQLDPRDSKAQGSLGNVYLDMKNYSLAEEQFEKALELNPDDSVARANLDMIRQALGARQSRPR